MPQHCLVKYDFIKTSEADPYQATVIRHMCNTFQITFIKTKPFALTFDRRFLTCFADTIFSVSILPLHGRQALQSLTCRKRDAKLFPRTMQEVSIRARNQHRSL